VPSALGTKPSTPVASVSLREGLDAAAERQCLNRHFLISLNFSEKQSMTLSIPEKHSGLQK
jgi:hypothetical protein